MISTNAKQKSFMSQSELEIWNKYINAYYQQLKFIKRNAKNVRKFN